MPGASFGQLLTELVRDLGELVRQELRLAQVEAGEKLRQARYGLYAVVAGLMLALCALLVLIAAVVLGLSSVMPAWLGALIVGLVLAALSALLVALGQRNLRARNLIPERTLRAARGEQSNDQNISTEKEP